MRFPGFVGEWERKKLGEIGEFKNGINKSKEDFGFGVEFVNLMNVFGKSAILPNAKLDLVNANSKEVELYELKKGDVLFIRSSVKRSGVGETAVILEDLPKTVYSGFLIRFREYKVFLELNFKKYCFYTNKFRNDLISLSSTSANTNINQDSLNLLDIYFPAISEQQKIASFLSLVDKKILSQNKIIEELKLLKSILCIKMFSLQLRFRKNNIYFPNWNVSKLNDLLSIPEKVRPSFIDKNKLLTVKLHSKGVLKNDNTDTLSLGATNYFIRKKGQFIYGKQNLFNGAFGLIPDHLDGFLSSGDVPVLDININKINRNFLIYYFSRETFYKKLENIAIGSGSKRIHENTLLNITIMLPCLEEQNKIAQFLTSIDKKIDIEIKVAQKLEDQKNFLLQQLFI